MKMTGVIKTGEQKYTRREVISMSEQVQAVDPEMVVLISATVAKYEREAMLKRMQRGKQAAKERRAAEKVQAAEKGQE